MTRSARVRAGADQRAGMHEAIGHHAVERRGDGQIRLQILLGLDRGLRGGGGLLAGAHQRLRGVHLLFGLNQLVAGDGAGRFRGLLETVVSALGGGQLRFGLQAVGFRGLHFGFGLGDLGVHPGALNVDQQVALFHHAAAVHQDALDIAGHFGVQRDGQEGQELAGQIDGSRDRLRHHGRKVGGLRKGGGEEEGNKRRA